MPSIKKIAYTSILLAVFWPYSVFADYVAFQNFFAYPNTAASPEYVQQGISGSALLDVLISATTTIVNLNTINVALCRSGGSTGGEIYLEVRAGATTSPIILASSTLAVTNDNVWSGSGCTSVTGPRTATTSTFSMNASLQLDFGDIWLMFRLVGVDPASTFYFSFVDEGENPIDSDSYTAYINNIQFETPSPDRNMYISGTSGGTEPVIYASTTDVLCTTYDVGCYVAKGMAFIFEGANISATQYALKIDTMTDTVLYSFPLGFLTDAVTIMATSATTSLPELYLQVPYGMIGGGTSAYAILSLDNALDPLLNATSTYYNDVFTQSSVTFEERTMTYWYWILNIGLVMYILRRILGSDVIPHFLQEQEDTRLYQRGLFKQPFRNPLQKKKALYASDATMKHARANKEKY